jgi:hypothetical protein
VESVTEATVAEIEKQKVATARTALVEAATKTTAAATIPTPSNRIGVVRLVDRQTVQDTEENHPIVVVCQQENELWPA